MRSFAMRTLGIILVVLGSVLVPAVSASAAPFDQQSVELDSYDSDNPDSLMISINRWKSPASGFSTNVSMSDPSNITNEASRGGIQSMYMSGGNAWWDAALMSVSLSSGMDVFSGMSYTVDSVAEQVLRALSGSNGGVNLIAVIMVIAIISSIIQLARVNRGAGLFKRLLSLGLVAGYISFAVVSILGPNAPSKQTIDSYRPGLATPSWVVGKVNSTIDGLASVPSRMVLEATVNPMELRGDPGKPLGCTRVLSAMENQVLHSENGDVQMRAMIDRMWQSTGLATWISVQFGSGNFIGNDVFCHLLDLKSSEVTPKEIYNLYHLTAEHQKIEMYPHWTQGGAKKFAMLNPPSNLAKYGTVTALAACNWDGKQFTGRGGFIPANGKAASEGNLGFNPNKGQDSNGATDIARATGGGIEWGLDSGNINQACHAAFSATADSDWWTGKGEGQDAELLPAFVMPGNEASVNYKVQGPRTQNFVANFYGTDTAGGLPQTFMYSFMAPIATLPIILIALGVIFMKLVLVFAIVGLWVAIMSAMFVQNPWEDRLKAPVMQTITTAVMAHGGAVALGMLVVFAEAFTSVGSQVVGKAFSDGGFGSAAAVTLASAAPMLALLTMHLLWKKAFPQAPSPFSVKGVQAWAKGAPLAASAIASGIGGYAGSRLGGMARGAGRNISRSVTDRMFDRGQHGGSKRRSSMGAGPGTSLREDLLTGSGSGKSGVVNVPAGAAGVGAADELKAARREMRAGTRAHMVERMQQLRAAPARIGQATARAHQAARANLALARTAEGRKQLRERASTRAEAFRAALAQKSPLSQETRTRIALQNQTGGAVRRTYGMLSDGLGEVSTAVKQSGVGRAAGAVKDKTLGAAHRSIMRSAGPEATKGQAYRRFGLQAAAATASLTVLPIAAPAVLASIGVTNARRSGRSLSAERQARDAEVVEQHRAKLAEAERVAAEETRKAKKAQEVEQVAAEKNLKSQETVPASVLPVEAVDSGAGEQAPTGNQINRQGEDR